MDASLPNRRLLIALGCAIFCGSFALGRWVFGNAAPIAGRSVGPAVPVVAELSDDSAATAVPASLADAMEGDDPFVCARRALAWIEHADAAALGALAENSERLTGHEFAGFETTFLAAISKVIAARWLAIDPAGAWAGLEKFPWHHGGPQQFFDPLAAACRLQPRVALEKYPIGEGESFYRQVRTALTELATSDPRSARAFAEKIQSPKQRKEAYQAIGRGLAEIDPMAAVALARETHDGWIGRVALDAAERLGPESMRQVLRAADGELRNEMMRPKWLARYPELAVDVPQGMLLMSDGMIGATDATDRLAPEERERLLAECASLAPEAGGIVAASLVSSWARTEPRAAADWAMAFAETEKESSPRNAAAHEGFLRWIANDADAALAWWRAQPASTLRNALGTNASDFLAEEGRLGDALELFRPHASENDFDESFRPFVQLLVRQDPTMAAKFLTSLPESGENGNIAAYVAQQIYERDPAGAARWVEALPEGKARDGAAIAFARSAIKDDAFAAAKWTETIVDPKMKQFVAEDVLAALEAEKPGSAAPWLRELRGVDPVWQARQLRRIR